MVNVAELQKINMFKDVSSEHLEQLAKLGQLQIFSARTVLFKENQQVSTLYLLLSGKVLLEKEISSKVNLTLGALKPGFAFGLASLIPGSQSQATAICIESCEAITLQASDLQDLFQRDRELGMVVMQRVAQILRYRLEHRTGQFLKAIEHHPEIQRLFKEG